MRFNLDDYETVESRIKRFYAAHEDGRIITEMIDNFDEGPKRWIVKSSIYLSAGDQAAGLPKATGHAFEIEGTSGANAFAALENSETSAIGRALANMNLSGNKRASREEMAKVSKPEVNWLEEANTSMNGEDLRSLYTRAKAANASAEILDRLKDYAKALDTQSQDLGTGRSGQGSGKAK
jgi:hypothetical protein